MAVGNGSVWVTNASDGTITQLNAQSGERVKTIDVNTPVRGIAYGGGSLWVTDPVGNSVIRVPVTSPSSTTRIAVGSGPTAIAYGGGQVWVTNNLAGTVSRIDPTTNTASGLFPVGAAPNGIAITPKAVWVSDEVEGTLVRLDPKSGVVTKKIQLERPAGGRDRGRRLGLGRRSGRRRFARGGNLWLLSPTIDYVDPALAYYPSTWGIVSVTGDGLLGFKRVGGVDGNTLVPDLATSLPQPSDHGRTYTFQLRPSRVRFSNGKEVTPADVRATFERMFRAYGFEEAQKDANGKLLKPVRATSPGLGYYAGIVGAAACTKHPRRCDLSRGIVTNDADRTVTFHLTAPDSEFLYKLAIPFAAILPKGTPVGGTQRLPGTGPYKVARRSRRTGTSASSATRTSTSGRAAAQPPGLPDTIEMSVNLRKDKGPPDRCGRRVPRHGGRTRRLRRGGHPPRAAPNRPDAVPGADLRHAGARR